VTVSAESLSIINGGEISGGTFGAGNSGRVTVNVTGKLSIDGTVFTDGDNATGIFSQNNGGAGNAGIVTVTAGSAKIVANGQIASSTRGSGSAGGVSVHVTETLVIDGTGQDPTTETVHYHSSQCRKQRRRRERGRLCRGFDSRWRGRDFQYRGRRLSG
jgi:hypothetical protein